jgi:hypothetical protein
MDVSANPGTSERRRRFSAKTIFILLVVVASGYLALDLGRSWITRTWWSEGRLRSEVRGIAGSVDDGVTLTLLQYGDDHAGAHADDATIAAAVQEFVSSTRFRESLHSTRLRVSLVVSTREIDWYASSAAPGEQSPVLVCVHATASWTGGKRSASAILRADRSIEVLKPDTGCTQGDGYAFFEMP